MVQDNSSNKPRKDSEVPVPPTAEERLKVWKEALARDADRDVLINKKAWNYLGK